MNRRYSPLSLRGHGSAHTVLLRMAEDEGRASRIADLKNRNPLLTWAEIARQVGVTERAATQWRKTGALKPENAEALARVFNVDFDYIWSGPRPDTPELFVERRGPVAVSRVEGELEARIARMEDKLDALHEQRLEEAALLARQTELLERIEKAVNREDEIRLLLGETATRLDEAAREAAQMLAEAPADVPPAPRARRKTAK